VAASRPEPSPTWARLFRAGAAGLSAGAPGPSGEDAGLSGEVPSISLHKYANESRVRVCGVWPEIPNPSGSGPLRTFAPRQDRAFRITVDPARPIPALARDISRRLLDPYFGEFRWQLSLRSEDLARGAGAQALASRLADTFGARAVPDAAGWRIRVRSDDAPEITLDVSRFGSVDFTVEMAESIPRRVEMAEALARYLAGWAGDGRVGEGERSAR
jgi:hypothetical protein